MPRRGGCGQGWPHGEGDTVLTLEGGEPMSRTDDAHRRSTQTGLLVGRTSTSLCDGTF